MHFDFSFFTPGIFILSAVLVLLTGSAAYDKCRNPRRKRATLWRMAQSAVALIVFVGLAWANHQYHLLPLDADLVAFMASLGYAGSAWTVTWMNLVRMQDDSYEPVLSD